MKPDYDELKEIRIFLRCAFLVVALFSLAVFCCCSTAKRQTDRGAVQKSSIAQKLSALRPSTIHASTELIPTPAPIVKITWNTPVELQGGVDGGILVIWLGRSHDCRGPFVPWTNGPPPVFAQASFDRQFFTLMVSNTWSHQTWPLLQ